MTESVRESIAAAPAFDLSLYQPTEVKALDALVRIEALLKTLVEILTPPVLTSETASDLTVSFSQEVIDATKRAEKIAALVPKDAKRRK